MGETVASREEIPGMPLFTEVLWVERCSLDNQYFRPKSRSTRFLAPRSLIRDALAGHHPVVLSSVK